MDHQEQQQRAQRRGHGQLLLPVPAPQAEQAHGVGRQQAQPQGKADHARLHHGLDIVVMDVLRLVVIGLHVVDAVFKSAHAQSDDGTALEQLHGVTDIHEPLRHVALGPQGLDAPGNGLRQQPVL